MQLYVLRQLLDTEKARVASTNEELHSALNNLQDSQIEKANALKVTKIDIISYFPLSFHWKTFITFLL